MPTPHPADRLVLTVRVEREDDEHAIAWRGHVTGPGISVSARWRERSREEARATAIGAALLHLSGVIEWGEIPAPAAIDIVDAPEEDR